MADARTPHRPNYADLNRVHEEGQQQEATHEPTRPEGTYQRTKWPDRADMVSQQNATAAQAKENNRQLQQREGWKQGLEQSRARPEDAAGA